MRRHAVVIAFSLVAFLLTGCPRPIEKPVWPEITFSHLPPLEFDVAEIVIETPYREPLDPPHVGEQFPVSPSRAALRWAEDRLRAVGTRGTVTVTILESSAVETELEQSSGLKGLLTKEQTERYEVKVSMEIKALDPVGPRAASASAKTTKSTTVREDATVDEREKIWYKLTEDTMKDFNAGMESQVRNYLKNFMK